MTGRRLHRRRRRAGLFRAAGWAVLLLAGTLAARAGAPETPGPEPAAVRQPTLRRAHPVRDADVLERIEWHRAKLPLPYRERGNFAWARVWTGDIDKDEYFAHSGIQNLETFSTLVCEQLADISLQPASGRFHVLCVNQRDVVDGSNCWPRSVDTEYKIIEDLAARLPDSQTRGRIKLYTDLPPCASCWNVLKQFMADYPHMRVQVLYRPK